MPLLRGSDQIHSIELPFIARNFPMHIRTEQPAIYAAGDWDLVLRIKLYDRYGILLTQSTKGRVKSIGWTAGYSGRYYVRIVCEDYSGDWY